MSIRVQCAQCGGGITAHSEQYLPIELALHRCPPDGPDPLVRDGDCQACEVGVAHTCVHGGAA